MSELLQITGVTKKYATVRALDDVNLTVTRGKIIGLLGPNGSGKTTLIKLINGLLTPTKGSILIDGNAPGVETKKIVSYLPDNNFLPSWMTAEQMVKLFADFYEDFRAELAYEMLDRLGVPMNMRLKNLSKETRRRSALYL